MTRPNRYLIRMLVFLVLVYGLAALIAPTLAKFYMANPVINSVIVVVEIFGIAWNLRQVLRLSPEVDWVERFQRSRASIEQGPKPRLLLPMARMFGARSDDGKRMTLSVAGMRSMLDGIASRLDESRELSRYVTGVMIFLGLLGTFWGLLKTVHAVAEVIAAMNLAGGDVNAMFAQLKAGLAGPLAGMGTAFSSSMFGLSGALILGFLDLTAGQAMNRFFNELEEWLAGLTRVSSGALGHDGEAPIPAYVQALLEQSAENIESLQRVLTRHEESRTQTSQATQTLTERMNTLTEAIHNSHRIMLKIGETQAALARIVEQDDRAGDEISRAHLRNIELLLARLIAEAEQGRVQGVADLRQDLKILTRTVAARFDDVRS
ncbi:flagellar motor protein MotA [Acidiphilium sp. AL]|uniref:Flagellar motor protein MotA n=1 Tax=Acidiphilium iwatense TaxID=768198 RepID=A0ABS9DTZ5_9PROT|nr:MULTISPECIES: flagellar motor protein MotA [Acidiphilium]MCF3946201.1 flagellar motor protein MotA [Acidiphilium iwatense]MCU4158773.1 flagellar motor protein MotA [Acidiphilium sp. AL]